MPDLTAGWPLASAAFFAYTIVVALVRGGLAPGSRRIALGASGIGLALTAFSPAVSAVPVLHDWVLPPALLLLGYWGSGALFVAPMWRAEAILLRIDAALGIQKASVRMPRVLVEILELAYVGVYPLIPIALVLHLGLTPDPDLDRFWTVILLTDYVCFGVLPWIQTRPPRALDGREPWRSSVRPLNLRLLGAASIRVNTFPSGHAAEALAAALLVIGAPAPVVAWMALNAVAISAGAVFGRYHYAADAITGWLVALAVFFVLHS
jgi:hypothetical protein